jgi:hypothetical protein
MIELFKVMIKILIEILNIIKKINIKDYLNKIIFIKNIGKKNIK